jgi:hypothetical protein
VRVLTATKVPSPALRHPVEVGEGVMVVTFVRCAGAAVAVALLAGGCSLGDRQHRADAIIDSVDAAFDAGGATGTLSTSMRFVRLPDGASQVLGALGGAASGSGDESDPVAQLAQAQQQQMQREFSTLVTLDLDRTRAAVALPKTPDAPFAVYNGLVTYGRRWSAGPRDARPWVRVDAADLNEGDELDPTQDAPSFFAFALNPALLVDLIAGPLTGSVKELGTESIDGVPTTHYEANFDIDKVVRKTRRKQFPEDRRKAFDDVLDVLAVAGRIHPGEVWLDDEGRPRRFTLRLKEEPIRHFVIEHTITLQLRDFVSGTRLAIPTARERVDLRSLVQYLRATIPSPRTPEFLTFLGVTPPAAPPATAPATPGATTTTTAAVAP